MKSLAAAATLLIVTQLFPVFARAGTTGGITGTITDAETHAPVAAARVTASSASQVATATTDAGGRYTIVSLAPDEYTIAVEKSGYDAISQAGVAVFADANQVVHVALHKALKTIANVTSRSASNLVRPGTTADVYSVNAAQQERASALGGGGNLNSAYSAIATVPGAYVPSNQNGYNQAVHVRGGDSSEVGYEFDGIPVNRGFDNYPSSSISSLGQGELQVYTGATPANAEAQGLAGFINQVIKTGTYPGFGTLTASLGAPTFYHSVNAEAGGSTPNRSFNYYVGIGGFNQDHRFIDQFNGVGYGSLFGPILDVCPTPAPPPPAPQPPPIASCMTNGAPNVNPLNASPGFILGPTGFGTDAASVAVRSNIVNLHFGLPHKNDGGRDDIQMLYDNDSITTPLFVSPLDEGLANFQGPTYGAGVLPYWTDSYQYTGAPGTFLTDASASLVKPYYFPSSPQNRPMFAPLALTTRDQQYNNQAIVKLQYQKNFSSSSYLRVYGYTYYSNYIATGAVSSWQPYTGYDSDDYQVSSHTRGVSASFAKQMGPHLLQAEASYTTSESLRMDNTEMYDHADNFAVLVNPGDLTSGTCYAIPSGVTVGPTTVASCNSGRVLSVGSPATFASMANTFNTGALQSSSGQDLSAAALSKFTCGGGPCALYVVENGPFGKYNHVKPNFAGYSLTDEYRPNDKLLMNFGVRLDSYEFVGANTTGTAARTFWFNAFNHDTCFNTQNLSLSDKTSLTDASGTALTPASPCSAAGAQWQPANMQNVTQTFRYNILQPRVGVTYTVNPDTVLRASWGKYNEQPSAAYEQYNGLSQNLPDQLVQFYALGFTTPGHNISPAISYNTDFSFEHHFKGTDLSMSFTPFLRQTHNQIENFYIDLKSGLVSGLNAGNQTSEGFELALNKGDFARNGLSAQLSFAYTYAYLKFSRLSNGSTILTPINADIQRYNAYTSFCAAHPSLDPNAMCYTGPGGSANTSNGVPAAACYDTTGAPVPAASCTAADVANPYWNAPPQALLDPNGKYLPYSTIPGGIGTGVNSYTYPYVATLLLGYKHNKWTFTPAFQYVAGNRYGAPETMPGIDPAGGCAVLSTPVSSDVRYPYGAPAGSPFDAHSCATTLSAIPDSYTGHFDNLGEFREPAQLLGHLRIGYDMSDKVSLSLTLANVISTCFGGQQTAFTYYSNKNVCSYTGLTNGTSPVGNVFNPGDNVQTFLRYPYEPNFGTYNDLTTSTLSPFSAYFNVRIKL